MHSNFWYKLKVVFTFIPLFIYCFVAPFIENTPLSFSLCICGTFYSTFVPLNAVLNSKIKVFPERWHNYELLLVLVTFTIWWIVIVLSYGIFYEFNGAFEGQHLTGDEGKLDYFQSIYFSAVTMSTLGYGDLVPTSTATRLCAIFQSLLGIILMISFIAVFMRTLQQKSKK